MPFSVSGSQLASIHCGSNHILVATLLQGGAGHIVVYGSTGDSCNDITDLIAFSSRNVQKTPTDQGRCTSGDSIIKFFVVSGQNYRKTLTNKVSNCRPTEVGAFLVFFRCNL